MPDSPADTGTAATIFHTRDYLLSGDTSDDARHIGGWQTHRRAHIFVHFGLAYAALAARHVQQRWR